MRFGSNGKEVDRNKQSAESTERSKLSDNKPIQSSLTEPAMKSVKEKVADTFGGVTYSLVVGGLIDYSTGLNFVGIIASRTTATTFNFLLSAPYGMWRNFIFRTFKTTENSNNLRKMLTDLLAFNTFQTPGYSTGVIVGSLISEGKIDWEKVVNGSLYLAMISPLIAPTFGWYMDRLRKVWGIKSAAEQSGSKLITTK